VDLKRNYNRANCKIKNLLSGDDWFEIQAYRAVNQGNFYFQKKISLILKDLFVFVFVFVFFKP
jgi:hypothetical protein